MRGLIVLLGAVVLLVGVGGCSSIIGADFDRGLETDAGPDTTEPTDGGTTDGSRPDGASTTHDAAAGDGAPAGQPMSGFVAFGLTGDSDTPTASAAFYASALTPDDANAGLDKTCTAGAAHGDCTVYDCLQPPPALPALPRPISAGPVSVSGMYAPFELDPTVGGQGAVYAVGGSGVPGGSLVPGELVTVNAPGDAFPAFTAQISVPPRLDLSSALPATGEAGVDTLLSWTAVSGTDDDVQVTFVETDGSSVTLKAQCSFLLGAGQGTVSGAVWESFIPAQPIAVTAAVLASARTSPTSAATYLSASTAAYVAPGHQVTGSITVD